MKKNKIFIFILSIFIILNNILVLASKDEYVPGESGKPAVVMTSASGKPGEEVEMEISIQNNPGICTMYLNIHYSESLELISAKDEGLLIDSVFSGDYKLNPFRLTWDDSVNIDNDKNGKIATLKFKIPENPEVGEYNVWITYNPEEIYNMQLENQYFEAGSGIISVEGFEKEDKTESVEQSDNKKEIKEEVEDNTIFIVLLCCLIGGIIICGIVLFVVKRNK